jgi:hypothetical protein
MAREYPDCWRELDQILHDVRADGVTWPTWCWAPVAAAFAVISRGGALDPSRAGDVARLAALAAWRPTQGIYRLDETLLDELWTSSVDGSLPSEVLHHLPEWCCYIETPGRELPILGTLHGFWSHLEVDQNDAREELRLLLDTTGGLVGLPLHLGRGAGTLADAGFSAMQEAGAQAAMAGHPILAQQLLSAAGRMAEVTEPLVSVVLYLATTSDELRAIDGRTPSRPSARPARRGEAPRTYPPPSPAVYEAGARLGAALRAARAQQHESSGAGRSPVGHVRRAHWHTYLLGPRDGAQRREVRWLPPILVRLNQDSVAPVIRPVSR